MKDFRKSLEDNYLTFITAAAIGVTLIALIVWGVTVFIKRLNK